jgi:hypothetical protein
MPRILVHNPRVCQVCLHCIGFSLSYLYMCFAFGNHICFISIFSLVCFEENLCRSLMGMTKKARWAAYFLS